MSYFETKVKMEEIQRTGSIKTVTKTYLFDALSFTEAESRATEELSDQSSGLFAVSSVRKRNFIDVLESTNTVNDKFYEVRLAFITINDSGLEKKTNNTILVQSFSLQNAVEKVQEHMKGSIADYELISVKQITAEDIRKIKHYCNLILKLEYGED